MRPANSSEREMKFVKMILSYSLLCSIILIFFLTLTKTGWILGLALFSLLFYGGRLSISRRFRKGQRITWFLSLAILNFLILVPELFLRLADFHHEARIHF
ncbi:hypothetical protein ACFL27_28025 [candidate division CSSED10-310 bacterium]|uniref:Uncharacterized protein n=1 Tax=candidate division CSSED10-310 bacterium TaxID=2855610 RepID=A0ABV6Z6H3_UNCC1